MDNRSQKKRLDDAAMKEAKEQVERVAKKIIKTEKLDRSKMLKIIEHLEKENAELKVKNKTALNIIEGLRR